MRETSIQAYSELVSSGALNHKQRAVYGCLKTKGSQTGRELDRELGWTQDAHKRLSELERAGVVDSTLRAVCGVTGRRSILWRLTGKDPNSVTREDLKPPPRAEISAEDIRMAVEDFRHLTATCGGASGPAERVLQWLERKIR